jgi:hypothetical protein
VAIFYFTDSSTFSLEGLASGGKAVGDISCIGHKSSFFSSLQNSWLETTVGPSKGD